MSKICSNCGAKWDNSANVCGNCGKTLTKSKPKKKRHLIFVSILLVVVITASLLLIRFFKNLSLVRDYGTSQTITSDAAPNIDVLRNSNTEFGESSKCGENAYWKLSTDGKLLVIYGTGCLKEDVVLLEETGVSSTTVGDGIEYVIVEEGITELLYNNFDFFTDLKCVYLPSSLEKIEPGFMTGCENCKEIIFPNGNRNFVVKDSVLFSADEKVLINYFENKSRNEYTIPSNVEIIKKYAFSDAKKIKKINVPSTVKKIEGYAFSRCYSLVEVEISDAVETIGSGLFSGCESLKKAKLPNSITEIPEYTFSECKSLRTYEINDGVEKIAYMGFRNCESLEQIIIPDTVVQIEGLAFDGCSKLSSIKLPSRLELLGQNRGLNSNQEVFNKCTSIKEIVIPKSCVVKTYKTFGGWTSEQTIYFETEQPTSEWNDDWDEDCKAKIIWNYNID